MPQLDDFDPTIWKLQKLQKKLFSWKVLKKGKNTFFFGKVHILNKGAQVDPKKM